ncbi:MAG: hypothetical protein HKN58_07520 [Xanthomonadales bacterium]|nr:hypothetical protein [Xanthomonadales bacterium]
MSFLNELKRRNVLRVGAAYIVTAWLIVQVVETLFPIYGLSDGAIRLVVNLLAVGLVPALVLSWVFEWTPDGLKKDADVDHQGAFAADAAKRLDRVILAVLALALGYFAFDKFILAPQQRAEEVAEAREAGRSEALVESYGEASIAVLAFENMSPDPEQEFFADGIAEDILNLLAGISDLRVISRSSSFTYKDRDVPVTQIADELNVAHVLEGSVRKAGDQIRVTAQLIAARSDTHLWSQTWDRALGDVFAIQDEIAAEVADQLRVEIVGVAPKSTRTDPEAYVYTLEARQIIERLRGAAFEQVHPLLQQALSRDPDYVPALETLVLLDQLAGDYGQVDPEQAERRWRENAQRVLSLDPDNVFVLTSLALYDQYGEQHEFEAAIDQLMRLIEREPNNTELLRRASYVLRVTGYFEEAVELAHQCIRVDPLKHSCVLQLKEAYMWWGKVEQAREYTDKLKARWNQPVLLHELLLLFWEGRPLEAKTFAAQLGLGERVDRNWPWQALPEHELGNEDAFRRQMAAAIEDYHQANDAYLALAIAEVYAAAGYADEAFQWLETSREDDPRNMFRSAFSPFLRGLHDNPRWDLFLQQLGLGHERRAAFQFEVPLPR